jgi:hypothetical protein
MPDMSLPASSPVGDTTQPEALTDTPDAAEATDTAVTSIPELGYGDTGEKVTELQQLLVKLGGELEVTGTFDRKTEAEIALLQKVRGLPATGRSDAETMAAFRKTEQRYDAWVAWKSETHPGVGDEPLFKPLQTMRPQRGLDAEAVYRIVDGEEVIDHRASMRKNLDEMPPLQGLAFGTITGGIGYGMWSWLGPALVGSTIAPVMAVATAGFWLGAGLKDTVDAGYHAVMHALGFGFQDD